MIESTENEEDVPDPMRIAAALAGANSMGAEGEPFSDGSCGGMENPATERAGSKVGPFVLVEILGEGGFATVWRAQQTEPVRREVALKVIKPGLDTVEVIARFRQEKQALAVMDHPNIAKVFDAGTTGTGRPYFVMEIVEGLPITVFCDKKQLTVAQRLDLFIPVCQAVQHAHAKGIVHRDLKPSNVLIVEHDGSPVPKVIDFGIAKALEEQGVDDPFKTMEGIAVGTPIYMSPEQISGDTDVDTRADVYSLGALLYQLLTGVTPIAPLEFKQAGLAGIERLICEEEPPRPSERARRSDPETARYRRTGMHRLSKVIRGDLDWIVMRALEKDRERRYETANALALELRRYLKNEPVLAGPPSASYRIAKFVRRHKGPLSAAAALFVFLIAGLVTSLWQARVAEERRLDAEKATRLAENRANTIRRNLYVAEMNFAAEASGRPDGLSTIADINAHWIPRDDGPDLRGWEWYYLESQLYQDIATLRGHKGGVLAVAHSPDGGMIASAGSDRTIRLWNAETRAELSLLKGHTATITALAWSPSGERIASVSWDKTLRIWEAISGSEIRVIQAKDPQLSVSWSLDGTRIGAGGLGRKAKIWNADDGTEIQTFRGDMEPGSANELKLQWRPGHDQVALGHRWVMEILPTGTGPPKGSEERLTTQGFKQWSPDGRWFAAAGSARIEIWNADERKLAQQFDGHSGSFINSIAWSPDGDRVASSANDSTIRLWDRNSGRPLGMLRGHGQAVRSVSWSPRDGELASGSIDGTVKIWDIRPFLEVRDWSGSNSYSYSIAWRLDGQRIACATNVPVAAVEIWDPNERRRILELTVPTRKSPPDCAWSPDGSLIAALDVDNCLWIWDAETGDVLDCCPSPGNADRVPHPKITWHPGGSVLAFGGQDDWITIYNVDSKKEVIRLPLDYAALSTLAWSPSGDRIIATTPRKDQIWDTATWTQMTLGNFATIAAWSPDGGKLATADNFGGIQVVQAADSKLIVELKGHNQRVECLGWSPDGKRIASGGGEDRTIRIWDAKTGEQLSILDGHTLAVLSLAWSPDGRQLVSGGKDRIILWDGTKAYEAESARQAAAPRPMPSQQSEP